MDEFVVALQKARLMAFLRHFGSYAIENSNPDALMLMGFAVGLEMAARHPETAANLLVEMGPPDLEHSLNWVVNGSPELDPEEPVN